MSKTAVEKTNGNAAADGTDKSERYSGLRPFKSGNEWTGNAKGRPKGSRNRVCERFLADLHDLWERRGMQILEDMAGRPQDQHRLLQAVVAVIPKDFQVSVLQDSARFVLNAEPAALSIEDWQAKHKLLSDDESAQQ